MIETEPNKQRGLVIEDFTNGVQHLVIPEHSKRIPIYNFRDLRHHEEIAKALSAGERMLMFAGVWGAFKTVKRNTTVEEFFHKQIKPGRPWEAKIPLMARTIDAKQMLDWSEIHEDFRFLQDYSEFKKLLTSHPAFVHIVGPVRHNLYSLPEIFITTPEDYSTRYEGNDAICVPTISIINRNDPYLLHLQTLASLRYFHTTMYLGVSTANPHAKQPPYTHGELFRQIANGETPAEAVDLIVEDQIYEKYNALGSHTIARLPLNGERPTIKILRIGSLSPERFERATGFLCEVIPGAKDVKKVMGVSLDTKLEKMNDEIWQNWRLEKPLVHLVN